MKFPSFFTKSLGKPKESKLFLAIVPAFKEKRTQQFTTLSLTLIMIAFFGLFAINPTIGTIVDLQKQLDDNNFVNDQLQKKIANLTQLQSQYAQLQPQLMPVFDAVPTKPGIDTLVGQMHQIAQQAGVQINRVQTFPVDVSVKLAPPAKYVSYVFTIEAQGLLPSIQSYMVQLSNFNRLITFDTIIYSRVGKIDNTFRITIRGKAYFKQAEAQ